MTDLRYCRVSLCPYSVKHSYASPDSSRDRCSLRAGLRHLPALHRVPDFSPVEQPPPPHAGVNWAASPAPSKSFKESYFQHVFIQQLALWDPCPSRGFPGAVIALMRGRNWSWVRLILRTFCSLIGIPTSRCEDVGLALWE